MAEMWRPRDKDTLERWIEVIKDEASDKLSEWESNFVDSVNQQLGRKGSLSQKQEEILEKIYTEKTS